MQTFEWKCECMTFLVGVMTYGGSIILSDNKAHNVQYVCIWKNRLLSLWLSWRIFVLVNLQPGKGKRNVSFNGNERRRCVGGWGIGCLLCCVYFDESIPSSFLAFSKYSSLFVRQRRTARDYRQTDYSPIDGLPGATRHLSAPMETRIEDINRLY